MIDFSNIGCQRNPYTGVSFVQPQEIRRQIRHVHNTRERVHLWLRHEGYVQIDCCITQSVDVWGCASESAPLDVPVPLLYLTTIRAQHNHHHQNKTQSHSTDNYTSLFDHETTAKLSKRSHHRLCTGTKRNHSTLEMVRCPPLPAPASTRLPAHKIIQLTYLSVTPPTRYTRYHNQNSTHPPQPIHPMKSDVQFKESKLQTLCCRRVLC